MPSDTRSRSSSIVPYRDNIDTHFWPSNVAKRAAMIPTTSTADPNAAAAAGEAGTTPSTSSNATGSTNNVGDNAGASNQDTASLMASLQAFFGPQLTTIKNGMADQQRQIDALTRATNAIPRAAPTAPQPSMLERQREFERSWEERARAELRQGYSNIGMSASQINEALAASPLPRPVRHQATGGNQNQAQAPAAAQDTTPSTAPTCRHTFRPDDIGTFDGDPARLEFFLGRIGSLYYMRNDAFWREPLLETIPLCLKDTAAQWYQTASIEFRASLVTWPAWEAVLRGAFAMDINTARRLADERKWDPDTEDVGAYFYEKMARLRAAYPDRSESSLCVDIWIGLPEAFMVIVKLGDEPTPAGLLRDCRQMQNPFKGLGLSKSQGNKKGSTPRNNPQTTATASVNAAAATPLSTTTMVSTSGAAPSPSNSRPRVSLAESYDCCASDLLAINMATWWPPSPSRPRPVTVAST